jgi:hypothetical protein
MENCCIIYFGGAKICGVTNLGGAIALLCSLGGLYKTSTSAVLTSAVMISFLRGEPLANIMFFLLSVSKIGCNIFAEISKS